MSFTLGGKVIDFYDDVYMEQFRKLGVIEKIADCQVLDPKALSRLPDSKFAVVFMTKAGECVRKFPLHDYGHTVLACHYFEENCKKLPTEAKVASATMIKRACEAFDVEPMPSVEKFAAKGLSGNVVDLRKLSENRSLGKLGHTYETLVEDFRSHRESYPRQERIKLAQSIGKVASKLGKDVPSELTKFAFRDPVVDEERFHSQCALRKELLADNSESKKLLDEFLEKSAEFSPREVVRLLETFDKEHGFDAHWDRGLDPYEVLAEKQAGETVSLGGADFQKSDLGDYVAANKELLSKMFDTAQVEKLAADPSALEELPSRAQGLIRASVENWLKADGEGE